MVLSPFQMELYKKLSIACIEKGFNPPLFPSFPLWITKERIKLIKKYDGVQPLKMNLKCSKCSKDIEMGDYLPHCFPFEVDDCLCAKCYETASATDGMHLLIREIK
jgi:hypothetical protein